MADYVHLWVAEVGVKARQKRQPTYRDALDSLRTSTEVLVQESIDAARDEFHAARCFTRSNRRPKARGMALEALYSGILDAVATSIAEMAAPGKEVEMAHLVADLLVQKVEQMSCAGRA